VLILLLTTKLDALWMILRAAIITITASSVAGMMFL
jgi:hypothetical protein